MSESGFSSRLERHLGQKEAFLQSASRFLCRCQWTEPDRFQGTVCPWELNRDLAFQEDFHDTLEALWVWDRCRKLTRSLEFDLNICLALEYINRSAERLVFSESSHPVTRGYDSAFILLLTMEMGGQGALMEQAASILKDTLECQEDFSLREYRNPFLQAALLHQYGRRTGDTRALRISRVPLDWLEEEDSLLPEYQEPPHKGPGGHDFFSSWGLRLYYLATVAPERLGELQRPDVTNWYQKRSNDEYAFNLSRCWGLGRLYQETGALWALEAFFDIWDKIPFEPEKGLPRQSDFPVPESWATFFQVYAYSSLDPI